LTSALDAGERSASRPGRALPPGKDPRYPWDRRLGGPQGALDTEARGKTLCLCRGSGLKIAVNRSIEVPDGP